MSRSTIPKPPAPPQTSSASGPTFVSILREQPALIPLLSIVMLVLMGVGLVSPVLSLYGASFGVGVTLVGMLITVFGVSRLLINIPAGSLSQKFGRRPVLLAGLVWLALSSFAAATTDQFGLLLVCRLLQGIGSGLYITSAMAATADLSNPQTRGRIMALYQAAVSVGTTLGPAFGGWIATLFGFRAPFWAFGILALVALVVAAVYLPETRIKAEDSIVEDLLSDRDPQACKSKKPLGSLSSSFGGDLRLVLASPGFLMISLISFCTFFTRTAAKLNLIPLAVNSRFGLGADAVGLILTLATVVNFVTLPFVGTAIDRFGNKQVVVWSSWVCVVSLGILAWANTLLSFWLAMVLFSVGAGICIPATGAYTAEVTPPDKYGPAMGIFRTISDAGFILGPLMVGPIVDMTPWGLSGGLMFNAVLAFCLTAAFWYSGPETVAKTA